MRIYLLSRQDEELTSGHGHGRRRVKEFTSNRLNRDKYTPGSSAEIVYFKDVSVNKNLHVPFLFSLFFKIIILK